MEIDVIKENWNSVINTVVLGATSAEGGSRQACVKVGNQKTLPFLFDKGGLVNKPRIAYEIWDIMPDDWSDNLVIEYGKVLNNPVDWAKKCVNEFGAELVCLRLQGAHPDLANKGADEEAKLVKSIIAAVKVPLIILGCGDDSIDNKILIACSQAAAGEKCLIGDAVQENYKTLAGAIMADGHNIIAESPIDVNIAKQLNILISDMGVPLNRIVINPTIGALGYGMEYAYSIMERARLAALAGDRMMQMPFIAFVGGEAWRTKEARVLHKDMPEWGDEKRRSVLWEALTASALLQAGADILVMRHPKAISALQEQIEELMSV